MKESREKLPPKFLTVVIRNDAPLIFCDDSPSYRSVKVELTEEQRKALALFYVGSSGRRAYFEEISKCFIED